MLKKILLTFSMWLCLVSAQAQNYPAKPNTLVNDYTSTLKTEDVQALEQKLERFADSTSTQIAVVLIKTTGGHAIDDYGLGLAKDWGIGQKGKNNGVLLLVATDDRKVTIQTGFGATGAIPESKAKQIVSQDLIPHFKNGDYYGGIDIATTDIMNQIGADYTNENVQQSPGPQAQDQGQQQIQPESGGVNVGAIVIVVIIVVVIIIIIRGRNNGGGGGGQIIGPRGGASPFWWFLGGSLLGGGLSNWGNGWGNNGGSDDGGSFGGDSGGNDSGGDFGGFGGGDFGGDGASGSW